MRKGKITERVGRLRDGKDARTETRRPETGGCLNLGVCVDVFSGSSFDLGF